MSENVIPKTHFRLICLPGEGAATCRYIAASGQGITCEKFTSLAREMDARVAAGTFAARSDNCPGFDPNLGWMGPVGEALQ